MQQEPQVVCTQDSPKRMGAFSALLSALSPSPLLAPNPGSWEGSACSPLSLHSALRCHHAETPTLGQKLPRDVSSSAGSRRESQFQCHDPQQSCGISVLLPRLSVGITRPARKKQSGKGVIQIRSLFIKFMFQLMQIKAFLSGEGDTNGVCDLCPRLFGAVLKTELCSSPLQPLSWRNFCLPGLE